VRLQALFLDFDHMVKGSGKDDQELREWLQDRLFKGEAQGIAEKQLRELKRKEKLNRFIRKKFRTRSEV
jgi:hypothetical protein